MDERLTGNADRDRDLAIELVERERLRPADLIGLSDRLRLFEGLGEDSRHVVDGDRLEAGLSVSDDRYEQQVAPYDHREQREKAVSGAENDRGSEDRRV